MIEFLKSKKDSLKTILSFCIVGCTNVLVSYCTNVVVLFILKNRNMKMDYIIANIIAFIISVFWSYCWNSRVTFKIYDKSFFNQLKMLMRTYITYAFTGVILNNCLSTFWIFIIHMPKLIVPLLNIPISMPINFIISRGWTYKENEK